MKKFWLIHLIQIALVRSKEDYNKILNEELYNDIEDNYSLDDEDYEHNDNNEDDENENDENTEEKK